MAQKSIEPLFISEKIEIDGVLDEAVWSEAPIATDFIQREPEPNRPASQKTEVQIAYDNQAIYIAAKLYTSDDVILFKELGPRDQVDDINADSFFVYFDTFDDDQNGFAFGVTSAGVQADAKLSNSNEDDFQWDGVWSSKTKITDEGWFVEMQIPYFNLRFTDKDVQNWGFNCQRKIRQNREQSSWNFVDKNIEGKVNQWGQLSNIKNIEPPLRLSFTPFLSLNTGATYNPAAISSSADFSSNFNAGMDLKYGLNDSFTLDMTLIPDFGGVRSDEQILNLGPFEQQFDENRTFFTEGTELFGKNRLFYSRRIGQRPSGYRSVSNNLGANEVITENPIRNKLLNATKISGRTKNNIGLGFFNAITNKSEALITNTVTGETRQETTEALTNYNILVAEKALKNASSVYLINTNVTRAGSARDANVTGFGGQLRDRTNRYILNANTAVSQIMTKDEDGLNENTVGYKTNLRAFKNQNGLSYGAELNVESHEFDPNDLGILFANNEVTQSVFGKFQQNTPSDWYRLYMIEATLRRQSLYKPSIETGYFSKLEGFIWLKNLSGVKGRIFHSPGTKDYFEPRLRDFETYLQRPRRTFAEAGYSTDYSKPLAIKVTAEKGFGNDHIPIDVSKLTIGPRFRFSDKVNTFITYQYSKQNKNVGFATIDQNNSIMGVRDRTANKTELNTNLKFNENMNISIFGRYNWDKVEYESFHTLLNNGKLSQPYQFSSIDNQPEDVNFSALNIDAIYRWRFAPGSDIIAVYKKQVLGNQNTLETNYFQNFGNLTSENHTDVVNLKVVYFIDYNKLRKKQPAS